MKKLLVVISGCIIVGILLIGCPGVITPGSLSKISEEKTDANSSLFITLEHVQQHYTGDVITLAGTTNLPDSQPIRVTVHEEVLSRKAKSGFFSDSTVNVTRLPGKGTISVWKYDLDTNGLFPQKYYVEATGDADISYASDSFYLLPREFMIASSMLPVRFDPRDRCYPGQEFIIGGNTTLNPGTELNISLSSGDFLPDGSFDTGYRFAEEIVTVLPGNGGSNPWTFSLNTTGFVNGVYLIDIRSTTGERVGYDFLVLHDLPVTKKTLEPVMKTPLPTPGQAVPESPVYSGTSPVAIALENDTVQSLLSGGYSVQSIEPSTVGINQITLNVTSVIFETPEDTVGVSVDLKNNTIVNIWTLPKRVPMPVYSNGSVQKITYDQIVVHGYADIPDKISPDLAPLIANSSFSGNVSNVARIALQDPCILTLISNGGVVLGVDYYIPFHGEPAPRLIVYVPGKPAERRISAFVNESEEHVSSLMDEYRYEALYDRPDFDPFTTGGWAGGYTCTRVQCTDVC